MSVNSMAQWPQDTRRTAIVLPGGGARSAYQVGVLKAIASATPRGAPLPFGIVTGTSAGGILASLLAAHAGDFHEGIEQIERFWRHFHVNLVFDSSLGAMLRSGSRLLGTLVTGGLLVNPPRALLDTTPLRHTLERHVNLARIRHSLAKGYLQSVAISASSYSSARSITFYDTTAPVPEWTRAWRRGVKTDLGLDHLMASAAVPFIFPPVHIEGEWFGDGAMRHTAPLSPALRLGADRIVVIGLRDPSPRDGLAVAPLHRLPPAPSFGHLLGYMLDTLFMDGSQADVERLERLNEAVERDPEGSAAAGLRHVLARVVQPTASLSSLTDGHLQELPGPLRILLRTLGARNQGGQKLLSFLLFEPGFTNELIDLGYADGLAAMARGDLPGRALEVPAPGMG
jgi:NTE family protein